MRALRIKNKLLPLLLAALFLLPGCGGDKRASVVGYRFDTVVTITGYCAKAVLDDALAECARYEALLSRTAEGSDVWSINHARGAAVTVADETAEVLALALELSRLSDGAFDVTIAPAVELWDFSAEPPALPDAKALAAAAEKTDWTKIKLDGNAVTLPDGMAIDLGGIAKGYIADRIADYLAGRGVECAVLNFGGNVVMLGEKPDGSKWTVGVRDPDGEAGEYIAEFTREGGAAVTSGVYERGFTLDGVRYHHILDTATGWPVQNGLSSVTVFCQSSAAADALSTACFALGAEKGKALMARYGAEGVFITDSGEMLTTDGLAPAS